MQKTITVPSNYYVGDKVEMRIILRTYVDVDVPQLSALPSWGEISDLRMERDGEDITILLNFIAYEAGTLTIPPIFMEDLQISGLSLFVSSILEKEGHTLSEPIPQLLLPHTPLYAFLLMCLLVIVPLILMKGWKFFRDYWRSLQGWIKKRRPWWVYHRGIARLQDRFENVSEREFYIVFMQLIRRYLADSLSSGFISATSQEIDDVLVRNGISSPLALKIKKLMITGDLVKFAQLRMLMETRKEHIHYASTALREIQTWVERRHR